MSYTCFVATTTPDRTVCSEPRLSVTYLVKLQEVVGVVLDDEHVVQPGQLRTEGDRKWSVHRIHPPPTRVGGGWIPPRAPLSLCLS